jgi:hypothetical protein
MPGDRACLARMVAAVSNRSPIRFMFYEGALDIVDFIGFLQRLTKDAGQKVFPSVNKLKVNHVTKVAARVTNHRHKVELFYPPATRPSTTSTRTTT